MKIQKKKNKINIVNKFWMKQKKQARKPNCLAYWLLWILLFSNLLMKKLKKNTDTMLKLFMQIFQAWIIHKRCWVMMLLWVVFEISYGAHELEFSISGSYCRTAHQGKFFYLLRGVTKSDLTVQSGQPRGNLMSCRKTVTLGCPNDYVVPIGGSTWIYISNTYFPLVFS
jgi:hypothetical protein